ncbi:MAG TPA: Uma2 family endonuclease [Pirellulales bacterium]
MEASLFYTPSSTLGPHRAADYFELPAESRVELLRGWLVSMDAPTADLTISFDDAYRATTTTVRDWLRRTQAQRDEAGLTVVARRPLVIEVKAPGRRPSRIPRLQRYARLAVEEYWFIDPLERFVRFYVLDAGEYVVHTGIDNRYQSPRLEGVAINLANFWAEVSERLTPS